MLESELAPFGGLHQRFLVGWGGVVLHLGEAVSVGERVTKAVCLVVANLHRVAQRDGLQEQLLLVDLQEINKQDINKHRRRSKHLETLFFSLYIQTTYET